MSRADPARVLALPPRFVADAPDAALRDPFEHFDPDAVFLTGESPDRRAQAALVVTADDRPLLIPGDPSHQGGPVTVGGIELFVAPDHETLATIADHERCDHEGEGTLDTATETFVVSNLLDVSVDTTTLSASLDGREPYEAALGDASGSYTHISGALPSDYRREWDSSDADDTPNRNPNALTVHGAGTADDDAVTCLDLYPDGTVSVETLSTARLGLRAISGVGETRADALRRAGYRTRADVADATPGDIETLDGFGASTARSVVEAAAAMTEGRVVLTADASLPTGDPVFIDVETDGLAPSVIWLVGVLDPTTGNYMSFRQRDPDAPGEPIEAFMSWLVANARGRPIVAYNGWNFDFGAIHDQVVEHCPRYVDDWTSTYRFDPYEWAVKDGNAVLPGLTNRLPDVAEALGWPGDETGLTGATVARRYREWVADPDECSPDWESFEAYCEDDVRALAHVYDELANSNRLLSTGSDGSTDRDTGTQGSLSDW
ncbi:ribonuclease H-like domain-containing protein [Haloarchaeobius amylolyticus]|uniref:ribonuclease H-like domain-containing protein n=1 Tax=Haloarchaeobius amylolyticus TaxID=1198296 RepID=UPI0022716729|nr:ribonuclease H-like domain-containing protein [Haloarchaeobius amylolyticus]